MAQIDDDWAAALEQDFLFFGKSAQYSSPSLVTTQCTAILNRDEEIGAIGNTSIVSLRHQVEVRVSELAIVEKGGTFTIAARDYKVVAAPTRDDSAGLVWHCVCDLQPAA